jgi:hypothetical protein
VDLQWRTPDLALGKAVGTSFDIVSLGRGGEITLTFSSGIGNGPGWDFAVFENSFSDTFLELGFVEVSSDGENFFRFPNDSQTRLPVGGFGAVDPTDITGYASKYRQGWGTPFDLSELAGVSPLLNVNRVMSVKIIDIVGDGSALDSSGDVIYDPYPTVGSAGVDLDAIGVIHEECQNAFAPQEPLLETPENGQTNVPVNAMFETSAFSDIDSEECNFHFATRWQISKGRDFSDTEFSEADLVLDSTSSVNLAQLEVASSILESGQVYYWRAQHLDNGGLPSVWSQSFLFTTDTTPLDSDGDGIRDGQELPLGSDVDLDRDGTPDVAQINDQYKVLSTTDGKGQMGIKVGGNATIEFVETVDPVTLPDLPTGSMPEVFLLDLMNFRIAVQNPGDDLEVVIYLSESAPSGYRWFKYDAGIGWFPLPDSAAQFSTDGRSVKLLLKDGNEYDGDGSENRIVIDPGGVGGQIMGTVPQSGEAGIGGGCFINALFSSF